VAGSIVSSGGAGVSSSGAGVASPVTAVAVTSGASVFSIKAVGSGRSFPVCLRHPTDPKSRHSASAAGMILFKIVVTEKLISFIPFFARCKVFKIAAGSQLFELSGRLRAA
jgi:hypothetical protein